MLGTRGGKREGAGRPTRVNKEGKPPKIILSCRVELETKSFLQREEERTGYSAGELVDLAVETLQQSPDKLPPDKQEEE